MSLSINHDTNDISATSGSVTIDGASIGGGATGGGSDEVFYENGQNVTANYTITNGKNAMSAGPITVDNGVTVTVGTGETWTVVQMSTLKVNTLEEATSGGATYFTAKAWVNFNGTGTVAIRDDGNVSSITDNGTGTYTTNLSAAVSSSTYSYAVSAVWNSTSSSQMHAGRRNNSTMTTTAFYAESSNNLGSIFTVTDSPEFVSTIFG